MLGYLIYLMGKAKPSLPEFRIVDGKSGFDVFASKPRYTLGLVPQHIGEEEVHVATIRIAESEDGFDLVVAKERATHRFPLTIPKSARLQGEGSARGWVFDWRFDEAAAEMSRCLKEQ